MLSRETPETVMSDEEIAEKLREDGVDIARRTVAKYRGCLSIPSSSQRRRRLARAGRTRRA
jgi:RNA polymerase sigma-54 factor